VSATDQTDSTLRASDDLALVRRMAAGDSEALGELYDRYAPVLLAIARRILGESGDAEEVLQEALVQAWSQAGRYDPARSSVSTWLVLLTRSRALDRFRSRGARERAVVAAEREAKSDTSSPAEANVLHEERRQRVREALSEIPPEQREVLELAFYEGLSQTEIAARTRTPLGTVKTRALLGMKKLRHSLRHEIRELL